MQVLMILLLVLVIACALAVALTKNLLTAAVVFMTQSLALSVIWLILESPDLGITEAAVGAGVDSLLLFATLKKIRAIDASIRRKEEDGHGEAP
ncbi:MAG: DUF4040 domain-containing protein [Clostridia bacterium]|nr:DUF4040 domain-containing protein [Clostridia bacterium]